MKRVINFGVIGVSGMGVHHLTMLHALEKEGLVRLVAVADPVLDQDAERRADFESRQVHWYSDYRRMLEMETELDAVTIVTPIPLHLEMVRACLKKKIFINLEKPPVPLIQQLDGLIEEDGEGRVSVCFQGICSAAIRRVKNAIIAGELGEIREIRAGACWPRLRSYYNRAAWAGKMMLGNRPVFDGPASNALAHVIHSIMYLASSDRDGFGQPAEIQAELYRAGAIESYDTACFRGRFSTGIVFSGALTHATEKQLPFEIKILGSRASARIFDDGYRFEIEGGEKADRAELFEDIFRAYYCAFISFAAGDSTRPPTRLVDSRGYVLATNGMLASSGQIRTIPEAFVQNFHAQEDVGVDVQGLAAGVEDALSSGKLFSESGQPWAFAPPSIQLSDLHSIDLSKFMH